MNLLNEVNDIDENTYLLSLLKLTILQFVRGNLFLVKKYLSVLFFKINLFKVNSVKILNIVDFLRRLY